MIDLIKKAHINHIYFKDNKKKEALIWLIQIIYKDPIYMNDMNDSHSYYFKSLQLNSYISESESEYDYGSEVSETD